MIEKQIFRVGKLHGDVLPAEIRAVKRNDASHLVRCFMVCENGERFVPTTVLGHILSGRYSDAVACRCRQLCLQLLAQSASPEPSSYEKLNERAEQAVLEMMQAERQAEELLDEATVRKYLFK